MCEGSLFSKTLPAVAICCLFYNIHPDKCKARSHCDFDVHFPEDWWCWASFHMPIGHLDIFFGKNVFVITECWILSKNFFPHLLRFSLFIFCNGLMWCITLIDLWILRHPHIPGINLSWSYYINPFNVVLNFVCKYFVEDFCTSVHQCYWSVHFCCCCCICVLFLCQVNVSFAEWV